MSYLRHKLTFSNVLTCSSGSFMPTGIPRRIGSSLALRTFRPRYPELAVRTTFDKMTTIVNGHIARCELVSVKRYIFPRID